MVLSFDPHPSDGIPPFLNVDSPAEELLINTPVGEEASSEQVVLVICKHHRLETLDVGLC